MNLPNLPILWVLKLFKKRLWDLDILFTIIILLFLKLNIGLFLILSYQEGYINNQYIIYKKNLFELFIRPVNPVTFFLISNFITFFYINIIYLVYILVRHEIVNQPLEFWRLNFILVILLSIGNFISNSSISFKYTFMGMPILRFIIYLTSLSFFTSITHYIEYLNSLLIFILITVLGLTLLIYSIFSQKEVRYKYRIIYINSLNND